MNFLETKSLVKKRRSYFKARSDISIPHTDVDGGKPLRVRDIGTLQEFILMSTGAIELGDSGDHSV